MKQSCEMVGMDRSLRDRRCHDDRHKLRSDVTHPVLPLSPMICASIGDMTLLVRFAASTDLGQRLPGLVVWKQCILVVVSVCSVVLPLSGGGVLQALAEQGLSFAVITTFLVPVLVTMIIYLIFPLLMRFTSGWALRPDCPQTRAEPCRTLEDGFCVCRQPRRTPSPPNAVNTLVVPMLRASNATLFHLAQAVETRLSSLSGSIERAPSPDSDEGGPATEPVAISVSMPKDRAGTTAETGTGCTLASRCVVHVSGPNDIVARLPAALKGLTARKASVATAVDTEPSGAGLDGSGLVVTVFSPERITWQPGHSSIRVDASAGSVAAVAAWRDGLLRLLHDTTPELTSIDVALSLDADDSRGTPVAKSCLAFPATRPPLPGKPPLAYKTVVAVSVGLYPSLVFVGAAAGEAAVAAGTHPLLGTLATICTAVPLVVFVAAPLVALALRSWMIDHASGECACCPSRVRFCLERGCLSKEPVPDSYPTKVA